ncbi:MAG: YraN family protein [Syntrophomonadaceae bacterium]
MNRQLGLEGEKIAAQYLLDNGYRIIERNYYTRYGELDIICERDKMIIFVEVKTRKSTKYGLPQEAITPKKIEHLKKAAITYLKSCTKHYQGIRFDVIAILITTNNQEINHIIEAF